MEKQARPTGLGILVDEKRVNDLLTQKTGAKAVIRSGCNLLLFILFLVLFTILALSEPLADYRAFEAFIRRRFDTSSAMPLSEVTSASSFWDYVDASLLPGFYGNDTAKYFYPGYESEALLSIEGANRLFGLARIRMLNINANEGCKVMQDKAEYFPTCYGPFDANILNETAYGPPDKQTGDPVFYATSDPGGASVAGDIATYPPGGFMQLLTSDYNQTSQAIGQLRSGGWIVPGTRAVIVDWTIYNFNLQYLAVCRILFEVGVSGGWVTTFDIEVLIQRHMSALGSRTTGDWLALLGEVILVLFVLRYLLEEASEFIGFHGKWPYLKWDYFGDAWNVLDWLNLGLMVVTLVFRIMTWGKVDPMTVWTNDPALAGPQDFTDMTAVAANVRLIHRLIAFNTVLTWFKAVKYIAILPYITTFMGTVSKSQRQLMSFMAVFSSLLFGFVLAYTVAFGEQLNNFRSLWKSFVFLSASLVGNSDMSLVYNHAPLMGSLLILLFVLAMFFVSVNLFYAIMISALGDVKQEEGKNAKKWEQTKEKATEFWSAVSEGLQLEHRLRTIFPGLHSRCKMRRKRQREKDEEREEAYRKRESDKKIQNAVCLGPANPSLGRRSKPASNRLDDTGLDSESEDGSEVDLGPLRDKAQLKKGGMFADLIADAPEQEQGSSDGGLVFGDDDGDGDLDERGVNLVIEATRHVIAKVVHRTYGARGVLVTEMTDAKDVLGKVGSVLEVLQTRTRDLEALQRQLLRHF